jgi:signal transduction histidine kinase
MHSGVIWVTSALDKGSTFFVALPTDIRKSDPLNAGDTTQIRE